MLTKTFNRMLLSMMVEYLDKMSGYGNGYPNYEIDGVQLNEDTIEWFAGLHREELSKLVVKIYSDYLSIKEYSEQEDIRGYEIPF